MKQTNLRQRLGTLLTSHMDVVALLVLTFGFVLRLVQGSQTYLNPDEASYFWMSLPSEFFDLYRSALDTHHPALLIILLHYIRKISDTEVALRMIPIAAGAVFPLFVYLWLGRTWNKLAGLFALTILALAPHIISLSAQVRAYTLVLLFMSASLYFLDRAIDEESILWMALSAGLLYLGTFSEYSFVFFAGSIAIYFLLRVHGQKVSRELIVAWVITQAGVLALYGFHYLTHVRELMGHPSAQSNMEGWLRGAFPWPGDNLLVYAVRGAAKQFAYVFASIPGGIVMACLFLFGLIVLWQGRSSEERKRTRAILALFVMPFLFACAGGLVRIHPYGRSRHTVFLAIFIAAGVAVALERLVRSRKWTVLPAMFVLIPFWHLTVVQDQNNIRKERHQREMMLTGIEYVRRTIPHGSLIFADGETRSILNYYLGPGNTSRAPHREPSKEFYTDYRLVALRGGSYRNEKEFLEDFVVLQEKYGISPEETVWVVDGGFDLISLKSRTKDGRRRETGLQDFGRVLLVFQTPPYYRPAYLMGTSS